MPCRPGLSANIQPLKMRLIDLSVSISSTSAKASVCGASVEGREKQTRGVICSEPNCTVSLIATSKEMIRPVILSSPAKTAVGCLILSARAVPPQSRAATDAAAT